MAVYQHGCECFFRISNSHPSQYSTLISTVSKSDIVWVESDPKTSDYEGSKGETSNMTGSFSDKIIMIEKFLQEFVNFLIAMHDVVLVSFLQFIWQRLQTHEGTFSKHNTSFFLSLLFLLFETFHTRVAISSHFNLLIVIVAISLSCE